MFALITLVPVAAFAIATPPPTSPLIISEFRVRGPSGANDEFVEIYNPSSSPTTVQTTDGSAGFAVAASDGVIRFTIPNGTVIPAGGHYLGVNSVGYSLSSYPSGNGSTATGDATYTTDIPDNAGIAIFGTATTANFNSATRLDAVGSNSEANTLYREGSGYPALTPFSIDYSFARRVPGAGDFTSAACLPLEAGLAQDTGSNSVDFLFYDTNGTSAGAGQRLGAPAPQNLASPVTGGGVNRATLIDPSVAVSAAPNFVRDFTSTPAQNSTFGTVTVRRRFTNTTGQPITRLRFRVTEMNTFPAPSGYADLRTRTSTDASVTLADNTTITVHGTTMEQPPNQPNGGAYNATYSVPFVTTTAPLQPGQSIDVQFLMGIQQTGTFRFFVEAEANVGPAIAAWGVVGSTEASTPQAPVTWSDCAFIPTTTAVAASKQTIEVGDTVTLTATVTSASGTPTGEVSFKDTTTNTDLGNGTLNANGVATLDVSTLVAGAHDVEATYAGDGDHSGSKGSLSQPIQVNKKSTQTTLEVSTTSTDAGQNVTFTATVDHGTGEVIFKSGTTELGRGTVSSGKATFSTNELGAGAYSVTATYVGDADYATSTSAPSDLRIRSLTTLQLTAQAASVVVGTDVVLNVTTSANGGTVEIYEGTQLVGSDTLSGASGSVTLKSVPAGTHAYVAKFGGSLTESAATSNEVSVVVSATTTITLSASTEAANKGDSVTFKAKVVASAGMAKGTVTFFLDGSELSSEATDESGEAVLAIDTLALGDRQMKATFTGDAGFEASESNAVTVHVSGPTTTTLTAPATSLVGEEVTFSAQVTSTAGAPSGAVEFREGETLLKKVALDGNGDATYTTNALPRGVHTVTAVYIGDGNFGVSNSDSKAIVVKSPTKVTLTADAQPGELTLTATVAAGDEPAAGQVEFFNGETSLGTVTLDAAGVGPLKVATATAATYSVTARYAGTDTFVESVSEAKSVAVTAQPIDNGSNSVPTEKKGCGCSSNASGAMLLSLLGLAAIRRRRV